MEEDDNRLNIRDLSDENKAKAERIEKVLKFYRLTKSEMSDKLDIHQSNLSKILLGKRPIGKSMDAKFLLAFPDINRSWYLTGEGDMLNEGYTTFDPVGVATPTAPNLENEIKILQIQLELKEQLIDSLQAEVNTLKDMNKQLLQAITKSIESNTQQKSV